VSRPNQSRCTSAPSIIIPARAARQPKPNRLCEPNHHSREPIAALPRSSHHHV
jgi:hypothetical protein